jgi:hypothetical protein
MWIDVICIDQENKGEKYGQISLMREVYSLAMTTTTHLGHGTVGDEKVFPFINGTNPVSMVEQE